MVSPKYACLITVERDDVEVDVEVHGVFCRGTRGSFYEPPQAAGVENVRAYRRDTGDEIELDDTEMQWATDALMDASDDGPDPDRAWDERGDW